MKTIPSGACWVGRDFSGNNNLLLEWELSDLADDYGIRSVHARSTGWWPNSGSRPGVAFSIVVLIQLLDIKKIRVGQSLGPLCFARWPVGRILMWPRRGVRYALCFPNHVDAGC